jgi:N-acyl-D-aspartate/D-glutamate deacylase
MQTEPLNLLGPRVDFRFSCLRDFLDAVEKQSPIVNYCILVGHASLRLRAMNYDEQAARPREASPDELELMKGWVEEAMLNGAIGLSTGTLVLCFMFYVLCFMFYVLCFMFYVLCFIVFV